MEPGELRNLVEESSNKLLRTSCPPVRYWLLKQVMERDEGDAELKDCNAACNDYGPKIKLLKKLRPDGTWPIPSIKQGVEDAGPGPPMGWTYRTILWNLFALSEYNTSRDEGHVNEALQKMLKWQNNEGYIPGPWTDAFPLPYFNGLALYTFLRFGLEENPGVQKMKRWLLSEQRPDGGWIIPYVMDVHTLPEYNWMKMWNFINFIRESDKSRFDRASLLHVPSCQWSTLLVVRGLSESRQHPRSRQVMKGADLVLDRFFKRNPHSSYYMIDAHWTKLRHPAMFGSGLMALDLLTKLGYGPDDQRMEKPISWLLGARSADGLWNRSQRPQPEKDQWISLIALRTLHRYSKNR